MKRIFIQKCSANGWIITKYIDSVYYISTNNCYHLYIGLMSGKKYIENYSTEEQCKERMEYIYKYVE